MRGKRFAPWGRPPISRIIPAHAGQTVRCGSARCVVTDHPRACGANGLRGHVSDVQDGSSPRMRGKLACPAHYLSVRRIIPAHAGQTMSTLIIACRYSDHPRACGANEGTTRKHARPHGSSPRMRGKQQRGGDVGRARRIIPAHAGQTWTLAKRFVREPDHPRACGANQPPPW